MSFSKHLIKAFLSLILLVSSDAHSVIYRWVSGQAPAKPAWFVAKDGVFNSGGPEVAGLACAIDTGNGGQSGAPSGQWGEKYLFSCTGGGFLDTAMVQSACLGFPNEWGWGGGNPLSLDLGCLGTVGKGLGKCQVNGNCYVGDPINPGIGNQFEEETDFAQSGPGGLEFKRYYNSRLPGFYSLGVAWRSTIDRTVVEWDDDDGGHAVVYREDGRMIPYRLMFNGSPIKLLPNFNASSVWVADADITDKLITIVDDSGSAPVPIGYTYKVASNDDVETYFGVTQGLITSIVSRTGLSLTFSYGAGAVHPQSMTDSFGRQITFTYGGGGFIQTMIDTAGNVYWYSYDADGNLSTVTYPDMTIRTFLYNEPAHDPSGAKSLMTGIKDELGTRFATFDYDVNGMAVSAEHAGGADKFSVTAPTGSVTITDPIGVPHTATYTTVLGLPRATSFGPPCDHCGRLNYSNATYDANANVLSRTDFNNNKTCYSYDLNRNLETARIEGAGNGDNCANMFTSLPDRPDLRKISTLWHLKWRLPVKIGEPRRITTLVYNGDVVDGSPVLCAPTGALVNGEPIPVVCSQSIQPTTDTTGQGGVFGMSVGSPSTWTYTYNEFALLTSATDPNGKTTLISYYDVSDANKGKRGNIATITNPLGHVTSITDYDVSGHPLSITDPNGMVTTLTYHIRGWLTSRVAGGETTTYDYDDAGQLKKVTLPDSSYVQFSYDDAHRLTQLQDGLGNQIVYTLDAMGNHIMEDAYDPAGQLAATRYRVYDTLNRLHQAIAAR